MARIVGHKLGDMLKQTVIVENKPGASSMVATDYVARSAKDGYTLMFATIATTINMTLMAGKAPNVEKDMTPITLIGSIPNILVVNPKLPVKSVTEEEAGTYLSWLAPFFQLDIAASAELTRRRLGWEPSEKGLLADMEQGTYF